MKYNSYCYFFKNSLALAKSDKRFIFVNKEKVLKAAKKKGKELQDKAEDLVKLAKEKGTPVLEGMANDLREKVISAAQEVIDKLEEK